MPYVYCVYRVPYSSSYTLGMIQLKIAEYTMDGYHSLGSIEILSTKDIENVVDTNIALYSLISEGLNFRNCYICTQMS